MSRLPETFRDLITIVDNADDNTLLLELVDSFDEKEREQLLLLAIVALLDARRISPDVNNYVNLLGRRDENLPATTPEPKRNVLNWARQPYAEPALIQRHRLDDRALAVHLEAAVNLLAHTIGLHPDLVEELGTIIENPA